jgi:hypothetical protein
VALMTAIQSWWRSDVNRSRVRRIAAATGVLVAVNVVARVIARYVLSPGTDPFVVGGWSILAMLLVLAVAAFLWTRRRRVPAVVGDLFFVIVATSLLVTLLGPFVTGDPEFGASSTISQLALCAGLLTVGAAAGLLLAMALGLDPTSRAWQAQAERVRTKPGARRQSGARR